MILGAEAVRAGGSAPWRRLTSPSSEWTKRQWFENLEGGLSIDGAEVGLSLIGKGDALSP